ncbi:MAG TPA: hypothetical protein VNA88_09790 [Candidatus Kapabacteria bacterium]|nr:hypothetical protein [Candidatus Kapabacteria bacterium]
MKLILAIFVGFLTLAACSERVIPPVDGPQSIEFSLVYPQPPNSDAYFGVSGVRLVTDEIVRDTLVKVTGRSFFGQFYTGGAALPTQVELNGVLFERHAATDTLRLGATDNTNLFGVQAWRLTDAEGPMTFQVAALNEIDSVAPLMYGDPLRADTALALSWRPPSTATGGVLITWRMAGVDTYSQIVTDMGRFTIPANIVGRFAGDSELILTRFRTDQNLYRGKQLILTRVAQRNYRVSVLG